MSTSNTGSNNNSGSSYNSGSSSSSSSNSSNSNVQMKINRINNSKNIGINISIIKY